MKVVIDSNVLFSALIRDSTTRRIILESDDTLLFPEYIFEEMERHMAELLNKSGLDKKSFGLLLGILLDKVTIVPKDELAVHRERAVELAKDIDIDDAVFVACVLANPGSLLWTDDRKLRRIEGLRIISTAEMVDNSKRL